MSSDSDETEQPEPPAVLVEPLEHGWVARLEGSSSEWIYSSQAIDLSRAV